MLISQQNKNSTWIVNVKKSNVNMFLKYRATQIKLPYVQLSKQLYNLKKSLTNLNYEQANNYTKYQ